MQKVFFLTPSRKCNLQRSQLVCSELSDVAELSVMMGIVIGSIIISPLLGYQPRIGGVYSEETWPKAQ